MNAKAAKPAEKSARGSLGGQLKFGQGWVVMFDSLFIPARPIAGIDRIKKISTMGTESSRSILYGCDGPTFPLFLDAHTLRR
ncbi:MAG TPA: hypothetical protein VGA56_17775 [Opitutaceae bacterium]